MGQSWGKYREGEGVSIDPVVGDQSIAPPPQPVDGTFWSDLFQIKTLVAVGQGGGGLKNEAYGLWKKKKNMVKSFHQ